MNKVESAIGLSSRTTRSILLATILTGCDSNNSPVATTSAPETRTVVACPLAVRFVPRIPECSALMREACHGQCGVGPATQSRTEHLIDRGMTEAEATTITLGGYCAHLHQLSVTHRMHLAQCVPTL